MDKLKELVFNSFDSVNINPSSAYHYGNAINYVSDKLKVQVQNLCNDVLQRIDFASSHGEFHITYYVDNRVIPEGVLVGVNEYLRQHGYLVVNFGNDYNDVHTRLVISWVHVGVTKEYDY